jgi:hypothetical protein
MIKKVKRKILNKRGEKKYRSHIKEAEIAI